MPAHAPAHLGQDCPVGSRKARGCDVRIAADSVKWEFVFARRGIAAACCCSWFLPRAVGISNALDWRMTGRMVPAAEAHSAGLVRSLRAPEALLDAALEIADEIAAHTAPVSVAMNRQLLWRMLGAAHPAEAHALKSHAIAARLGHPDSAEGVAAFSERRLPQFATVLAAGDVMSGWWPATS